MEQFEIKKMALSKWWQKRENEDDADFSLRIKNGKAFFWRLTQEKGLLIISFKKINGWQSHEPERVYWSKERPLYTENGKCAICKDSGIVKTINPEYENGFYDKGGIYADCPHLKRS